MLDFAYQEDIIYAMQDIFFTSEEYNNRHPKKPPLTLSAELREILKYPIGERNASLIINQLDHSNLFKFPHYLDQRTAITFLTERSISPTDEFTEDFWDNLDRFCAVLVQYFSSDDGKRMRPQGPTGTTIGHVGGTDPRAWEQTPRKRGGGRGGRRKPLY